MMQYEILRHIITIVISISTAVTTTFLINYMKDKKRKVVEQTTPYDDRISIINCIAIQSMISFILGVIITGANLDQSYKLIFVILIDVGIVFFTYANLRFHKSFLIKTFQDKETKWGLISISTIILIMWIFILVVMFFIKSFGDKLTYTAYLLILFFYMILFNLRQYFKWQVIRNYRKIIVVTIDGNRHETRELMNLDDYKLFMKLKEIQGSSYQISKSK